ncbi:MAG: cyanoexosortase B system-associated protein [Microcoleus sp.]
MAFDESSVRGRSIRGALYQLPITNYLLPITNYQLPITYYEVSMIAPRQPLRRYKLSKIIVLLLLLVLVGTVAIPGYLTGRWPWTDPPPVTNLKQLKILRQKGIRLPGWQTTNVQKNVQIGGRKWLAQEIKEIKKSQTTAILLFLPQNSSKDQPQVEWLDIKGFHRWQTDSDRTLKFTVRSLPIPGTPTAIVEARFFRSWTPKTAETPQQTFSVLQWYALPSGGSTAISRWFWEDSIARLSNRRISWVAVSIIVPIQPAADIDPYRPLVQSIGEMVQAQLMLETFQL